MLLCAPLEETVHFTAADTPSSWTANTWLYTPTFGLVTWTVPSGRHSAIKKILLKAK